MPIVIRYNGYAVDSLQQRGGVQMDYIFNFLLSVMAGVAGYYICKWLDRNHKDSKPKTNPVYWHTRDFALCPNGHTLLPG